MSISIFTDKKNEPTQRELKKAIGDTFEIWATICKYVQAQYPKAIAEWNFAGAKFGWSFRIKDKKRTIVYLLPRDRFFRTAFVFGQKATDEILSSTIADMIKSELDAAKVYAEGRGIRLDVRDVTLKDIKKLINIKLIY